MFRSRSWFGGSIWRNKNPHSLEHLKYLYNVLSKNRSVSENNRGLLVETLRSIAEILIWGDQNDSSVFDFFLEKNMLSFFLKILKQKCGSYVCVQLLQTLNILFENIRNETSLYYLLSNNHVNSIIVHKFDFSDEEVMAYYISFLKTLSLKLNSHTIHFFYNDHTNDFPLYTEAIKFFKHPESMVRIAVRTLTLNVYRVQDHSMLRFIRNKTAAPYFSNLVWFIGNHVLELDTCVRNDADHSSQSRLADLVAEHLDHLHYLNDILSLNIEELNDVFVDHLLHKLFIPLYIFSLLPSQPDGEQEKKPSISCVVSLFLLSQVFLITRHNPLVHDLAQVILHTTTATWENGAFVTQTRPVFGAPNQSLEESLDSTSPPNTLDRKADEICEAISNLNITDEEKEQRLAQESNKVFIEVVVGSLDSTENDYAALFALCLLYAISQNAGINSDLISGFLIPSFKTDKPTYNNWLVQKLINIISASCQAVTKVRLITLELAICLLLRLVTHEEKSLLTDAHLASLMNAKEESTALLRNYYKMVGQHTCPSSISCQPFKSNFELMMCSGLMNIQITKDREEMFGEMFENEDEELRKKPLNVEFLMMDSNILLPPTGTPLTGIEFGKRLPCGEVERARRAIRVFLLTRGLCMKLAGEQENQLPLTNRTDCIQNDITLNLTNSDLLSCHVIGGDGVRNHRFLVVESNQIILVVPVPGQLGYGRPKMAALLHDLDVSNDKQDSRSLYISAKYTTIGPMNNTKFIFDDSIRCMAAQQRLTKGRLKAREEKMREMEKLLDIPVTDSPSYNLLHQLRHHHRSQGGGRTLFSHRLPGFATPVRISQTSPRHSIDGEREKGESSSTGSRSRESSPKSPKLPRPRSEEIQMESMSSKRGSLIGKSLAREDEGTVEEARDEEGAECLPTAPSIETSFTDPPLDQLPTDQPPPDQLPPDQPPPDQPNKKKGKVEIV